MMMGIKLSELGLRQKPSDITRLMAIALERPDILSLAAGFTDNDSLPLLEVKGIVDEIAQLDLDGKRTLQYGANRGRENLRKVLRKRIETSDTSAENALDDDGMFVSNGSQQALYLAIQTLCNPGDFVLVEQPTYFVFLEILEGLGVTPLAMPMNKKGEIDVESLRALLSEMEASGDLERIKALYMVSYFANPTGHSLSESTKSDIGQLLSSLKTTVAVIEDAAYRELYYENPYEARSCLAIESYADLPVLYTSTLTKPYASGLKVGYAYCTDQAWLDAMLTVKGQQDFGTANFAQAILERALECRLFDAHLAKLRVIYKEKMETLHVALDGDLKELGWDWEIPSGGLYLWLRSPDGLRTDADSKFHGACIDNGVFYVPGDLCHPVKENRDQIRLSFGTLPPKEIDAAAHRFAMAARSMTKLTAR